MNPLLWLKMGIMGVVFGIGYWLAHVQGRKRHVKMELALWKQSSLRQQALLQQTLATVSQTPVADRTALVERLHHIVTTAEDADAESSHGARSDHS